MEFGIINFVNALIVVFILIPNIIYAMKGGEDHKADNGVVTFLEQVGRYAGTVGISGRRHGVADWILDRLGILYKKENV